MTEERGHFWEVFVRVDRRSFPNEKIDALFDVVASAVHGSEFGDREDVDVSGGPPEDNRSDFEFTLLERAEAERDQLRGALRRMIFYVEHAGLQVQGEPLATILLQAHMALNADSTTEAAR